MDKQKLLNEKDDETRNEIALIINLKKINSLPNETQNEIAKLMCEIPLIERKQYLYYYNIKVIHQPIQNDKKSFNDRMMDVANREWLRASGNKIANPQLALNAAH